MKKGLENITNQMNQCTYMFVGILRQSKMETLIYNQLCCKRFSFKEQADNRNLSY